MNAVQWKLSSSKGHSCKWTALLTKPHFNSHKNYVFLHSCKRQQTLSGYTSKILAFKLP